MGQVGPSWAKIAPTFLQRKAQELLKMAQRCPKMVRSLPRHGPRWCKMFAEAVLGFRLGLSRRSLTLPCLCSGALPMFCPRFVFVPCLRFVSPLLCLCIAFVLLLLCRPFSFYFRLGGSPELSGSKTLLYGAYGPYRAMTGLIRALGPYKALKGPYKALKSLMRPLKGRIRPLGAV